MDRALLYHRRLPEANRWANHGHLIRVAAVCRQHLANALPHEFPMSCIGCLIVSKRGLFAEKVRGRSGARDAMDTSHFARTSDRDTSGRRRSGVAGKKVQTTHWLLRAYGLAGMTLGSTNLTDRCHWRRRADSVRRGRFPAWCGGRRSE